MCIFLTVDCSKEMGQLPSFGALSQIYYSNVVILYIFCLVNTHLNDSREVLLKLVLSQCFFL